MTSSSSAQKDKKNTFFLVSQKVSRKAQPAVVVFFSFKLQLSLP